MPESLLESMFTLLAHEATHMPARKPKARVRPAADGRTWRIPSLLQRLDWSAEQLKAEREARLRRLLRYAKDHSSW